MLVHSGSRRLGETILRARVDEHQAAAGAGVRKMGRPGDRPLAGRRLADRKSEAAAPQDLNPPSRRIQVLRSFGFWRCAFYKYAAPIGAGKGHASLKFNGCKPVTCASQKANFRTRSKNDRGKPPSAFVFRALLPPHPGPYSLSKVIHQRRGEPSEPLPAADGE